MTERRDAADAEEPAATVVRGAAAALPGATVLRDAGGAGATVVRDSAVAGAAVRGTAVRGIAGAAATVLRDAATPEAAPPGAAQGGDHGPTRRRATAMRAEGASGAGGVAELGAGALLKGRFELERLVGRGGMGVVWSALDRRKVEAGDPNPRVAVKILNAAVQQHPDSFVALQREASKAQTLAHPNIATVYDFDRDGQTVFITMELLRGSSLEDVIRGAANRGVGRATALPLIRGIADGLAYAHLKGIVHSDLKPANVFVTADGTAKILDFGIARAVPSAADDGPGDAFDAASLGAYTEAYATGEMVQGAAPAAADDLYALGIIVYELLAGRHPFAGKSWSEARAAGLSAAPIPGLRGREWRTVNRALAFERDARPRDAAEFLRSFFGSTRLRNAALGAIVSLAAAAGFLSFQNYRQAGPAVPFAALPAATQEKIRADLADGELAWGFYVKNGIGDGLNDSLSHFAEAYALHKGDRQAVAGLKRAADEILAHARSDPQELRTAARTLAASSEFLKTYPPVVAASGAP
jgi:predicted Ser/Thr protein kinase